MRRRRTRRKGRPWTRWVGLSLLTIVSLCLAIWLFLGSGIFRSLLVSAVRRGFDGDVELRGTAFLPPLGLRLEGLRVVPTGDAKALLEGERLDMQLSLSALLDGRLHLRSLRAVRVDAMAVRDERGRWTALDRIRTAGRAGAANATILPRPVAAAASARRPRALPLDRLVLEACSLQLADLGRFVTVKLQDLNGTIDIVGESVELREIRGRCLGGLPFAVTGSVHPETNFQARIDLGPLAVETIAEDFPLNLAVAALGFQPKGDVTVHLDLRSGLGVTSVDGRLDGTDVECRFAEGEGFVRSIRSRRAEVTVEGSIREGRMAFAGLVRAEGMRIDGVAAPLGEGDLRCPWRYAGSVIRLGPGTFGGKDGRVSLRSGFLKLGAGEGYELALEGRGVPQGAFLRLFLDDVEAELFRRFGLAAPEKEPETLNFRGNILGQGGAVDLWEIGWGSLRARLRGSWKIGDGGEIAGRLEGDVTLPERSLSQNLALTFEGPPGDLVLRLQ